ncbi:DUF58 domain-containing protein [Leucobacter massiliensis]|uniref:DUF58 domain-containing protein n=1 Tax=Leucobacter massiliensis TaxID=1686285 RepID=A0A2S9QKS6_9MICO|nr:DUF58 domain-containing protein [Leucobacter massiliensis]PRI10182.1 hypothetical protein B4915_12250 [Leucobacter massiliensis]
MSGEDTRSRLFRTGTRGTRGTRGTAGSRGSRTRGTTRTSTRLGETRTGTRLGETRTGTRLGETRRRRVQALRWWRLTRRRIARGWRGVTQAVTPLGWFVLALSLGCAALGASLSWVEAWYVAAVGALLLVTALPFLLGNRAYRVQIEIDRARVVAGGQVQLRLRVENAGGRPALPAVAELPVGEALRELTIPAIGAHSGAELPLAIPAPHRGVIRVGPLTVARRDPLGLLRREVTWPDRHLVHVHPATAQLPPNSAGLVRDLEGTASRRLTDSDLSFYAVREYAPGDAMRHVHWKSTAKTGTLMVRQYEESQTARVAVLFDARPEEYQNAEEFELAVSVAASVSVQAVREGRERFIASAWAPGRVRPSIDGLEELPARDPVQLLDSWSELEAAPEGFPFEELASGLAHSRRPLSIVVIVTGSLPGPARLRRAAAAFSPDVHVLAARCELFAEPRAQRAEALTMFTVGALGDLPQLMFRSAR